MNKSEIEKYLRMLGQELLQQHVTGVLLLMGGAVMVLTVGSRVSTRDIDASFENEAQAIRVAVSGIAAREGLPDDWLNDCAKGFLYTQPPTTLWQSFPGLDVYLVSPEYLLAMKIVAGRQSDIADARDILQYVGISDPQPVFDILQRFIPVRYLTARVQYIVNDLFA